MNNRRTYLAPDAELAELLDALCEDRLSAGDARRLERIVSADSDSRAFYLAYLDLHGTLYWDTAVSDDLPLPAPVMPASIGTSPGRIMETVPSLMREPLRESKPMSAWSWRRIAALAVACCVLIAAGVALTTRPWGDKASSVDVTHVGDERNPSTVANTNTDSSRERDQAAVRSRSVNPGTRLPLHNDPNRVRSQSDGAPNPATVAERRDDSSNPNGVAHPDPTFDNEFNNEPIPPGGSSLESVVAGIDRRLRAHWRSAGVEPSPVATDGEWIRRTYLNVTGRIPSADDVEAFLADKAKNKRRRLVDRLLDDPLYARNFSTLWANLLVGRSTSPDVNRPALEKFLRDSFARNRPWNDVVYDVVSAEGDPSENGAANFLVAHLNDQAVPATAVTARLFMGVQFQCIQCHDHPTNDWTQNQFWELNSFFQQTEIVRDGRRGSGSNGAELRPMLVSKNVGGPIYFEDRRGLMLAAFPRFAGVKIDPGASVDRRVQLARLMTAGDDPLIAGAMVNRVWHHFVGRSFTNVVDDMGPHDPPTHPELLDRLAREFVASGYDLKRLIRWVTSSDVYHRTSRFGESNTMDDPEAGYQPLFSRVYVRPMTPEQAYDSLLVASRAHLGGASDWDAVETNRREWLKQFVVDYHTDENDEASTFEGSISQSLAMMNGELMDAALSARPGTTLKDVASSKASPTEKIRRLTLTALSRQPTPRELAAFKRSLRPARSSKTDPSDIGTDQAFEGLQDVFWALLNSGEFILVH